MPNGSKIIIRNVILTAVIALTQVACAEEKPQSTVSRSLNSGITSNNGGGMAPANFGTIGPIREP